MGRRGEIGKKGGRGGASRAASKASTSSPPSSEVNAMSPTASPKSKQALSISVGEHCRRINALADKLANAERKIEEYQRSIGQHIAAIKAVRPNDWEKIVKAKCKLGRSRAYELLAIADGTKTVKQTRAEKAGSV